MTKTIIVSPSSNPCPINDLLDYGKELLSFGADWLHCDIMDGKFVPAKTFDEIVLSLIAKRLNITIDTHLMIENPIDKLTAYAKAGATNLIVHYEALKGTIEVIKAINRIHELGCKAGLSIKPNTDIKAIESFLPFLDLVLVMSVEPGKSGQPFIHSVTSKIAELNSIREHKKLNFLIEVDGGINRNNVGTVVSLGADAVVLGNAMYNAPNRKELIDYIKSLGEN